MPFVESNGVRLNTSRLGHGPPLVMIHGLLVGNMASWYFGAAPALAKHHSVLLYDLRGHGRSERPPCGYRLSDMTADLAGLVANEAAPLTLVGHSYGALVALNFALQYPAQVERLVLVEAPLPPSQYTEFTEFVSQDPDQMMKSLPPQLQIVVAAGGRRARRFVIAVAELVNRTTILNDLQQEPDISAEQLAAVTCPTLAVYGQRSPCRPVADRLREQLPNCRAVLLEGGHLLPLEAPAALLEQIERFCRG